MNADVFQAALAATARVACCAALVSCHKSPQTPTDLPPMMEHAEQAQEKPAAIAEPRQKDSYSQEFEACSPKIEAFVSAQQQDQDYVASEEVLACCELQGKEIDTNMEFMWKYRNECCMALEWQGPFACTPWGPPTPPHMMV